MHELLVFYKELSSGVLLRGHGIIVRVTNAIMSMAILSVILNNILNKFSLIKNIIVC